MTYPGGGQCDSADVHLAIANPVLPGDLGIRKAAQRAYRLDEPPHPKALEAITAPWRPYRTRGCLYLWTSHAA